MRGMFGKLTGSFGKGSLKGAGKKALRAVDAAGIRPRSRSPTRDPPCPNCKQAVDNFEGWANEADELGIEFSRVIVTADPKECAPVAVLNCVDLEGLFGIVIPGK